MKFNLSLTVIVTAYNEENNVLSCIEQLENFLDNYVDSYQIILVDDGSTDATLKTVSEKTFKNYSLVKMYKNQGVGACIKAALPLVQTEWFCWFPSDLEFLPIELLKPVAKCAGLDIVVTHALNSEVVRSSFRYYLSKVFNEILNLSFSRNLKYYNGITFYRKDITSGLSVTSNRFFFHAELLLKSLNKTSSYTEVPIVITPRKSGKSGAIRFKVLKDVIVCYCKSLWELKLKAAQGKRI